MTKRTYLLITILFPLVAAAQMMTGQWKTYSAFDGTEHLLDTPSKVYFVSNGSLVSYDKDEEETYIYNSQNKLNDNNIDNIYYNPEKNYLAVVYDNSNIDLVYDNGKVVNLGDIKDSNLTASKKINYITFGHDCIYVAADFGVVIFDDEKLQVVESGIYNETINMFTRLGDHYVIHYKWAMWCAPVSSRINSLSKFEKYIDFDALAFQPVDDTRLLVCNQYYEQGNIASVTFDFNSKKAEFEYILQNFKSDRICYWKNGFYMNSGNGMLWVNDSLTEKGERPLGRGNAVVAIWDSADKGWEGSAAGVTPVTFESGEWTPTGGTISPATMSVRAVDQLQFDKSGNLLVNTLSHSRYFGSEGSLRTPVNLISKKGIDYIDPETVEYPINERVPADKKLWATTWVTPHPTEEGVYFMSNYYQGIYKFKNRQTMAVYNHTNAPLDKWWGCTASGSTFDPKGNFWIITTGEKVATDTYAAYLTYLPAAKVDNPSKEDWIRIPIDRTNIIVDGRILYHTRSNVIIIAASQFANPITFYDTKGTPGLNDDKFVNITTFVDQDGRDFSNIRNSVIFQDRRGRVWIGTDNGVFEIADPKSLVNNPSTPVTRIKVPRNDGTNLADYLLSGQLILSISEDSSGRKWIATAENGVYLVSEDGTQIIENYTADNSPLPSNKVNAVACDPAGNSVFFGTPFGLVEYSATSSPSKPDYSEIIAYPNPVRPDFSGWITIKGLMDNSLVKIADSAGNVIFTTRSEGGMAVWDGCNSSGQRVKTGVYYVFASQSGENTSTKGAVTKIMVVN